MSFEKEILSVKAGFEPKVLQKGLKLDCAAPLLHHQQQQQQQRRPPPSPLPSPATRDYYRQYQNPPQSTESGNEHGSSDDKDYVHEDYVDNDDDFLPRQNSRQDDFGSGDETNKFDRNFFEDEAEDEADHYDADITTYSRLMQQQKEE